MKHRADPEFWICYRKLPPEIRALADKSFQLLKSNPQHASLRFKKVGRNWSVRVGLHYRAVAVQDGDDYLWIWIGHHSEYDRMI
jgi:hypothetical protein